ncbi:hypothetical protein LTR09_000674 [Extremus antarcticus]|uniref:BOD1/SHG1 domain-containing protein n=1 Tax=Extremus antarcticus TaxID=702011 RepID=A0AAJ0GKA4_9PEZI|nr:hypothetical protein LTR09_000674 [Extremus antarcticus]
MASIDVAMSGTDDYDIPPRKKPKTGELPLSSAQRASIDTLLHTFKKRGEFDSVRKKAFQQYNESASRGMFEASLRNFTTNEIEREPVKYLKPDRRIAAPLLEGAAARGEVYAKVERDVDAYIEEYLAGAENALRELRRQEIGDETLELETERGSKSEETYAAEADQRRKARAKKFADDEKGRKRKEASEKKKKELEGLMKKQEELKAETEKLQREQKRRAERDAWKNAEKEKERERIRKFNEERDRLQKELAEKEAAKESDRLKRQRERDEREAKRLEEEALDLLLREGKQMAEKSRRPELERSESMEPPPRLMQRTSAPRDKLSRVEMRSQGLMPTSLTLRKGDRPAPSAASPTAPTPAPGSGRDDTRPRSRTRRDLSPDRDDRRSSFRDRDRPQRTGLYRDISAEREAWKARQRPERGERGGGGGEEDLATPSDADVIRARLRDVVIGIGLVRVRQHADIARQSGEEEGGVAVHRVSTDTYLAVPVEQAQALERGEVAKMKAMFARVSVTVTAIEIEMSEIATAGIGKGETAMGETVKEEIETVGTVRGGTEKAGIAKEEIVEAETATETVIEIGSRTPDAEPATTTVRSRRRSIGARTDDGDKSVRRRERSRSRDRDRNRGDRDRRDRSRDRDVGRDGGRDKDRRERSRDRPRDQAREKEKDRPSEEKPKPNNVAAEMEVEKEELKDVEVDVAMEEVQAGEGATA